MNDRATPSKLKGSLTMAATMLAAIVAWILIDVALAEQKIDRSDPSTWPNMPPAMRLALVPELFLILLVAALVTNLGFGIGSRRELLKNAHWAALGLAYSLPALTLAVAHIGIGFSPALVLTSICTIVAVWWAISGLSQRHHSAV